MQGSCVGPILQVVDKVVTSAKGVCLDEWVVIDWKPSSPNFGLASEFGLLRESSIRAFILVFGV